MRSAFSLLSPGVQGFDPLCLSPPLAGFFQLPSKPLNRLLCRFAILPVASFGKVGHLFRCIINE